MEQLTFLTCHELKAQGTTYGQAMAIVKFHRMREYFAKRDKKLPLMRHHKNIADQLENEYSNW